MSNADALYVELQDDIVAIADPLLDLAEKFLREQGNFLPFGRTLGGENGGQLIAAWPNVESNFATSTEVLPRLINALGQHAHAPIRAVAFAENVSVSRDGGASTNAIKVSVEHERGLSVALYLPFEFANNGDLTFKALYWLETEPQVNGWRDAAA